MVFRTFAIESISTTPYSDLLYTLGKPKHDTRIGKAVKCYATNRDIQMAAAIRAPDFQTKTQQIGTANEGYAPTGLQKKEGWSATSDGCTLYLNLKLSKCTIVSQETDQFYGLFKSLLRENLEATYRST